MSTSDPHRRAIVTGLATVSLMPVTARLAQAQEKRFKGRELVSSGFGGSTQDIIQKAVFDPFEAESGAKTTQVPMQSATGSPA